MTNDPKNKFYEVRVTQIIRDYFHIEAKNEDEAKELINETLYGRGIYGKKVDTVKHSYPKVDYAVEIKENRLDNG